MTVNVRVPTPFRSLTAGATLVEVDADTVGGVIDALEQAHPGFHDRLISPDGTLHRFVNVFVADEDIRSVQGLNTLVPAGETISIVPAVAGG
jgi:molybdopterin converting factor small subunit